MKDTIASPRFANAPAQFDPALFDDFQRRIVLFLNELLSTGPASVSTLKITSAPTTATGQTTNTVYSENGYLRLVGSSAASFRKAGTDTIANTATTEAVAFTTAMPDTNYSVAISTDGDEFVWVTSKATTGFTLNRMLSVGNRVVDWVVVPHVDL